MKVLKTIGLLLVSIVLQAILLPFRVIVWSIQFVESVLKITRETTTFLIGSIQDEVLKPLTNGINETKS